MHIPARENAPIACDMSDARDTPDERLLEYETLFARSLLRLERTAGAVVLAFRAEAREQVEDLARREAACCPFADYRVELREGELIWTITAVDVLLDAFCAINART
jgi:hypothetical protein